MQLDYTTIIPNDRFVKPVDRDDDVTQEESYVVVCVEEMCLCGGVNSIGKTTIHLNSSAFNNFISEIRDGQDNAVRRRISSWNLLFKKIMCTHCKDDIKKKIKISMNFNLLESIMTSTHYWFRENTGFPLKRKSFYFFFCFVNLRQYLMNENFLWHKSRSKHVYTVSFWNKKKSICIFSFWI